jgi:hypothetical protein
VGRGREMLLHPHGAGAGDGDLHDE